MFNATPLCLLMENSGSAPSAAYLAHRAAYYRTLAAKETRPHKIADYLDIAAILEKEAAATTEEEAGGKRHAAD
jgi:hypothetical protein